MSAGVHCAAQAGIELTVSYFSLLSAGIHTSVPSPLAQTFVFIVSKLT